MRTGTCPSLTGKSKLTYELGRDSTGTPHLRIAKNSGTGFFNAEWLPWAQVQQLLDKNAKKAITSYTFEPLFRGKSVNTAGFLLAALKQEGVIFPSETRARCWEALDTKPFLASLKAPGTAPKKAAAGAPAKKPKAPKTAKR